MSGGEKEGLGGLTDLREGLALFNLYDRLGDGEAFVYGAGDVVLAVHGASDCVFC